MESDAQQIARRLVLERFVLGTLEEDARAVLRARVIADPNVFAEVREIELDLLDAAAREALAAERLFAVEPERRPASGAGARSGTGLDAGLRPGRGAGIGAETGVGAGAQTGGTRASHAIAVTPYAGHVSAALAARALLDEVPSRADDHRRRTAAGVERRPRPVYAARVRLWPAVLWLTVAFFATSFPSTARRGLPTANRAAPDPHVAAPFLSGATTTAPDTTDVRAPFPVTVPVPVPVPVPAPSPTAGTPAAAAPPFLRIDLTFAGDRLGAHVTSPGGMFPGVWSLEIDNGPRGTRPPAGQTTPVPGREP